MTDIESKLRSKLRRMKAPPDPQEVDERAGCVYGLVTRQILTDFQADLSEIKARVNGILFTVGGAVLVELILRLALGR